MRVDITIKQGCLWIESHAENALKESKRHMAVSGKIRPGKRGFSAMANDICMCKCTRVQLLRSFAVPELLKSALVLVVVVVVVVVLVLVVPCSTSYFFILRAPKNRWIGCVFRVFLTFSVQKKYRTYRCFWRLGKPKTMVFTVFSASDRKIHSIYNVFWPGPSKSTCIYAVFSMLQEDFHAKGRKTF